MSSTNNRDHGATAGASAAAAAASHAADTEGDAHPPLWSSDPTVNALVIMLLQKGLTTEEGLALDHGSSPSLPSLLETLKARMQEEQQALAKACTTTTSSTSTTDKTQSRDNKTQPRSNKTQASASSHGQDIPRLAKAATEASVFHRVPTVSVQSETDTEERHENLRGLGTTCSTGAGAGTSTGATSSSSKQDEESSEVLVEPERECESNSKPTRRELLEALQQHMDILEKRGMVSNVIPGFLRRPTQAQVKRGFHSDETGPNPEHISTSSTKAVQHGRKRQRQCTSKFQYYEDLATELLQNVIIPIPETIYVPLGSCEDVNALDSQTEGSTEFTGDSTDLESFCSTASSTRKSPHYRAVAN